MVDIVTLCGETAFSEYPDEVLLSEGIVKIQCLQSNDAVSIKLEIQSLLTNSKNESIVGSITLSTEQVEQLIKGLQQAQFVCDIGI